MSSHESKQVVPAATLIALSLLFLFCPGPALAQYPNQSFVESGIYSLDVPVDARGNAMGESFVALQNNSMAMMYNPAGLSGLEGIHVLYARRGLRDRTGALDINYQAMTVSFQAPLVNIGITYNRFDRSGYDFSFSDGTSQGTTHIDVYDYTLALSVAAQVTDRLAVGVGVKTFDVSRTANASWYSLRTTRPALFDLGILFSHPDILTSGQLHDSYALGATLQNFGTDFRGTETVATRVEEGLIKLPRYVRMGVSYTLALKDPQDSTNLFSVLFTGEYRNLLNAGGWLGGNKDFWGFGVETSFLDILSVRLGGYIQPFTSILGSRGTPALRYGVGFSIPFSRIGIDTPLGVRLEYAGMPMQNYAELFSQTNKTWEVEISYPPGL